MQALGFDTYRYRACYVISADVWPRGHVARQFPASFINPTHDRLGSRSGELMFMVIIGERRLHGPLVGTLAFVILEEVLCRLLPFTGT
jgi:ABC-type branched-subunit amino acid transport system permease subunit